MAARKTKKMFLDTLLILKLVINILRCQYLQKLVSQIKMTISGRFEEF